MKANNLDSEAEKILHEFSIELKHTKSEVKKMQHRMLGLAIVPLALIPLAVGYAIFKKRQTVPVPVEIESTKELTIQKEPKYPWVSTVLKEIAIIFAGKVINSYLPKFRG